MARTDPDPALEWELRRAAEAGLLQPGELLVEAELASLGWASGALVVTDRRVLFVNTGLFRRRRKVKVTSVDLADVRHAKPSAVWGMTNTGELTLTVANQGTESGSIEFGQIPGGMPRANEIAESILRERALLLRRESRKT